MKKISIILISVMLFLLIFWNNTYWAQNNSPTTSDKQGYELYKDRVTNFCSDYKKTDSTWEIIYLIDEDDIYPDLSAQDYAKGDYFVDAIDLYKKNMDWIYDCATWIVNYRALKTVQDILLKWNERLWARLKSKIDNRIRQTEQQMTQNWKCKITSDKNDTIIKKSVLNQTTYEYCRYTFYLEYLKEYSQSIVWLTPTLWELYEWISIKEVLEAERQRTYMVNTELNNVDKTFVYAFKAYSEYENNIIVHILLELLKEDFLVLREELHKTLNPINQVAYKIKNAMMK